MKKITGVKYGILFLGTVLYLFLLAIIILPKAAEENRKQYNMEVQKWKKAFQQK